MPRMTEADRIAVMNAIAAREGSAGQISKAYGVPVPVLRKLVDENKEELARLRQNLLASEREEDDDPASVSVADLSSLWITDKTERIRRFQAITELLYKEAKKDPTDSTVLRELRSYMAAVANELGQLLHRGSGEAGSDSLSVDIQGVNMDDMR